MLVLMYHTVRIFCHGLHSFLDGSSDLTGGYFHTGDQGFLDDDQFLTLTGRIKELINRGGEKISPIEVTALSWCETP